MRYIVRLKPSNILLVKTKKLSARRKIVIKNIKHLAINSRFKSGQDNRSGAVVNVCKRNEVRATQMEKRPKGCNSYSTADCRLARSVHVPRSNCYGRKATLFCILKDDFVLL